jgi:hypothetical protein
MKCYYCKKKIKYGEFGCDNFVFCSAECLQQYQKDKKTVNMAAKEQFEKFKKDLQEKQFIDDFIAKRTQQELEMLAFSSVKYWLADNRTIEDLQKLLEHSIRQAEIYEKRKKDIKKN